MSQRVTRALAKSALNGMGAPARLNYAKLAGKATRKNKGPKVNKKSVKSRKVPREVRNAINQVKMRFGKGPTKRRKGNAYNKGKRVEARRTAAAKLFRRIRAAANMAQENVNFARATREEERKIRANNAAFNAAIAAEEEALQAEEAAANLRRRANALEREAAGQRAAGAHAARVAGEPVYALASLSAANSPAGSYHGNSMNALAAGFEDLGRPPARL